MKKFLSICSLMFAITFLQAQIYDPVSWTFSQKNINEDEVELTFQADIEENWYIYSQELIGDGPVATEFSFFTQSGFEIVSNVIEPQAASEYDPNFDMELKLFKNQVTFKQIIKTTSRTNIRPIYFFI